MGDEQFYMVFPPGEDTAMLLLQHGQALGDALGRLRRIQYEVLSSGVQGAFVRNYEDKSHFLTSTLEQTAAEIEESAQDLYTVVERARQVNMECQSLFETARDLDGMISIDAPQPPRMTLDHIERSLDNFRRLRADQLTKIQRLHQYLQTRHVWKDFLDGLTQQRDEKSWLASIHMPVQKLLVNAEKRLTEIDAEIIKLETLDPSYADELTQYEANLPDDYRDKLLDQNDHGSCILYAAMNMLVQNGVPITQAESEAIFQDYSQKHDGQTKNFPMEDAIEILRNHGYEVTADYNDIVREYNGQWFSDASVPVRDLITDVQAGHPVYVSTLCNFMGDWQNGHAMVVNAVNLDANGNLESVRVTTNWGTSIPEMTIPADLFLDGWASWGYGTIRLKGQS